MKIIMFIFKNCDHYSKLLKKYGIIAPDNQAVAVDRQGRAQTLVGGELLQIDPWRPGHPLTELATEISLGRAKPAQFIAAYGVRQVQRDPESELGDYLLSELLQVPAGFSASADTS